jgi:hypothetical protein
MASTDKHESPKIEIEITTVLLGFLFVMDSIILTMPADVLTMVKGAGISGYFGIPILSVGNLFSLASLYCSLTLLVAIPFYLFYLRIGKEVILLTARTFLAISMYLIIILIVLINGAFMGRLIGTQSNAYMNPISGFVFSISVTATIAYILISWIWWLWSSSKLQSFRKKHFPKPQRQKS